MRSYHKALRRVAAILVFLALASVVAPRNSIGLPQLQSPIITPTQPQSPVITPTSAAYLPLAIRGGAAHHTLTAYLPMVVRQGVQPTSAPGGDSQGSISGAIWVWNDGIWKVPQGLVTIECWDGAPGIGGNLVSTVYSQDGYYLLGNVPPGTNYWVVGYIQTGGVWYAEMYPSPVTVLSGQETQYIDPLLMPPS